MTAEEWFDTGNDFFEIGEFAKALEAYDQATELNPQHALAWYNKGLTLDKLERYEEALEAYERVIELNPQDAAAWGYKGAALYELERYEEVLEAYDVATKLNPQYAIAWWNKGLTLDKLERYEEALEAYDQATKLNPQYVIAWCNKGNMLYKLERYEEAREAYDQATKLNPQDAAAWYNNGNTLDKLERYEEALEAFDQAIKLNPQDAAAWYNKGVTLDKLERYEEALEAYDQATELNPQYAIAWCNKGATLDKLERYEKALEACDVATKLNAQYAIAWFNKGLLLLKQPQLQEQDSCITGARCIYRSILLNDDESDREIPQDHVGIIIRNLHTPLLLVGFIERWGILPQRMGDLGRLALLEREARLPRDVLAWLEDEQGCHLAKTDRLRLKGQVYSVFSDPVRALKPLDKLDSLDDCDLTGQLYLWWAMEECLEETSVHKTAALVLAQQTAEAEDASAKDCYYGGQLYLQAEDYENAAKLFSRAGDWPPAVLMRWQCARQLGEEQKAAELAEKVLAWEVQWIDGGVPRSMLYAAIPPPIDPATPEGLEQLRWLFHLFEVQNAASKLLFDLEDVEANGTPRAKAFLKRIDEVRGPVHEELSKGITVWQEVRGSTRSVRKKRQKVDGERLVAWRLKLLDDLRQLRVPQSVEDRVALTEEDEAGAGVGKINQSRQELAETLGVWIHEHNLARSSVRVEECIGLLVSERRLAVHSTTLLAKYVEEKRSHDFGRPHRKVVQKLGVSLVFTSVLSMMGLEHLSVLFAALFGTNLTEWLAEHVAAMRSERKGEFPTYQQFVRELRKRWHTHGGPPDLEKLFGPEIGDDDQQSNTACNSDETTAEISK